MQKNIGNEDRIFRLCGAIFLFIYAFWQESILAALFGLFMLFEALWSWCVLYQILGKNSCTLDKNNKNNKK